MSTFKVHTKALLSEVFLPSGLSGNKIFPPSFLSCKSNEHCPYASYSGRVLTYELKQLGLPVDGFTSISDNWQITLLYKKYRMKVK